MQRDVLVGGHANRGEEQSQAQGQHHPRPNHLRHADLEVHPRHPVVAGGHDDQASRDHPAGVKLPAQQDAGDHHRGHRGDARWGHRQPGAKSVVAEQPLEQRRQRDAGAVHYGEGEEHDDAAHGEIPLAENPEVDDRVGGPHFADDQQAQPQYEQDYERLHASERVAQPVPFPPLAEHDLPAAHDQH